MRSGKFAVSAALAIGLAALLYLSPGLRDRAEGAVACAPETHAGTIYTVCTVDLRKRPLQLFLKDQAGLPFGSFQRLQAWLGGQERTLLFAMNAGMYHVDRSPVGLFVDQGTVRAPLNVESGAGNFFLKPNGVFFMSGGRAQVMDTDRFLRERPAADLATQSGPMLVIGGRIHPRFLKDSTSRKIRNGVCVPDAGDDGQEVVFVISEQPVTFHAFAEVFRDGLKCADALYLDGTVSGLFAPDIGRSDANAWIGPIIAVVE